MWAEQKVCSGLCKLVWELWLSFLASPARASVGFGTVGTPGGKEGVSGAHGPGHPPLLFPDSAIPLSSTLEAQDSFTGVLTGSTCLVRLILLKCCTVMTFFCLDFFSAFLFLKDRVQRDQLDVPCPS